MTVSVGLTPCPPLSKDLEQQLDKVVTQKDDVNNDITMKDGPVKCSDTDHRNGDITPSLNDEKEVAGSMDVSVSLSDSMDISDRSVPPDVTNKCVSPFRVTKQGRAVSRRRTKSDNKDYNQKSQGGGRNRGRKMSKSNRDYENSSSNGGNSGADGNGEDNGSDDDDEDDDADEDDDEEDDDDDDEGEDDDDDEDEESKNEDDDDDISLNGNEKNGKSEVKVKQEPEDQEMYPTALQSFMAGLDGSNIPLADLLEKLPNSVCPGDESGSAPVAPGVPVTLHGIVCHEIGGVLVVNIKWRNKFYCGSLIDCSRHAWASPRFPAVDGGESEMKMGGKGGHGKGKRRQKNNSLSSSAEIIKDATPLKHKLRGRKRGAPGCPPPKSQGFKGMGKRRSKNLDDDDDGPRPGKRSCTMKTTVSPQPSPTLIECPEPGCDKKYKHINGLRYHQAHAHLEESNHSDERSASTSPSPVEEFKEPDTKPGFKGRTSRVSARARSISPSLAAAMASISERKGDLLSCRGSKKKEITEPSSDSATTKEPKTSRKSPISAMEEDSNMEDTATTVVEISDKCQQACEHDIRKENSSLNNVEAAEPKLMAGYKHVEELETAVKSLESEKAVQSEDTDNVAMSVPDTSGAEVTGETSEAGKGGGKDVVQSGQEVWETVLDSGFSVAKGNTKSLDLVGDVEKALSENSFSGKQSDNQLCISGVQPVDLRQAVDTGVGLINQLGIEVEDISENEEDIDPGQDSEYTSKDVATSAAADQGNSCRESNSKAIPFADREHCLTQIQKLNVDSNMSSSSSGILRTKRDSSFYFDIKKDNKSQEEKQSIKSESKTLSECQSKRSELWTKRESSPSISLQQNAETKATASEDRVAKTTNEGISMEDLVSKSISCSAVEPPLINSDAPSMRYKFFECRNYGDDNYDKCIRTSEVEQKGTAESKATLAPIRYRELVRSGANTEASNYSDFKKGSSMQGNLSDGKLISKSLAVPSVSRNRSPIAEVVNRNLNLADKSRTSVESKSPSTAKQLSSSRSEFHLSGQPSSLSMAGSKVHSSMAERRSPSHPFQPVIVKHEFQSADGNKGIKQEMSSTGLNESDSKVPFMSTVSELGKQGVELKGRLGFRESSTSRSPRPSQETEDYEKSYKATSRTLSRPHPALISRNTSSLPPSLPVGVAHPYPRASDGLSVSSHLKSSEHKTSASGSSVTSVTYSGNSPIPLPSPHDVSSEMSHLESKAKQLQSLQVPIPVGEVSPVTLKRSPGPAIHSGLPPVLPIIGPGIKSQGSASSHPVVRPGIKTPGISEQIRGERKSEASLRVPSPYARSKSPGSRPVAAPKPSPERKSPPPIASLQKARATDDSVREDSVVRIVKEEPLTYGAKDKGGVEKERERRDARDVSAAEFNFRSQEPMSAEQLRSLQLQQQLTLQQYYHFSPLAYMQGMPIDPKVFQNMQPEQQMRLMQLHRQMMLEQEKQGIRSASSSNQSEARNFERKEITKSGDRVQEERRLDEGGTKKSPQGRLHPDISESEFRRFPVQAEGLQFVSRSMSPKVMQKVSPEEPAEKKNRVDDSYERERELERQKHKREEAYLQMQKMEQQVTMFNQLQSDLQKEQLGSNFPRKRQITSEKSESTGNSREDDRTENGVRSTREMIYHRPQDSATSTVKTTHHTLEVENPSGRGSPRGQVVKSLSASRSPRPSRSPVPASRSKDSLDEKEKREGSGSLPANFMPTQFQAYLSQLNFDPSTGPLPYGPHQMLVGSQFAFPPGLVMSMPLTSHGESNTVTSVASSSREREERSPYRSAERDRSSTATSHSNSQSRMSTSEPRDRLQRIKDADKEPRHSPVMFQEERARNRSATGEQNVSPKSSSRPPDLKSDESSSHGRPSIISNNLAISRMGGDMVALTEEELMRHRFAAEFGDPRLNVNYYVPPSLIRMEPAYANMMQSSSQHMRRGMEHYMTKRP